MTEDEIAREAQWDAGFEAGFQEALSMVEYWAKEQMAFRGGHGGYAKGQRYVLRLLIELWGWVDDHEG